jgi:hypothetical protein
MDGRQDSLMAYLEISTALSGPSGVVGGSGRQMNTWLSLTEKKNQKMHFHPKNLIEKLNWKTNGTIRK